MTDDIDLPQPIPEDEQADEDPKNDTAPEDEE